MAGDLVVLLALVGLSPALRAARIHVQEALAYERGKTAGLDWASANTAKLCRRKQIRSFLDGG